MKRIILLLIVSVMLTGCGAVSDLEVVQDEIVGESIPVYYDLKIALPEEASSPTLVADDGALYICDDFNIAVQKLPVSGIEKAVETITGLDHDRLTIIKTSKDGLPCYRFAWTVAGEATAQSCIAMLLDDGMYYHAVTIMADASLAGGLQPQWNAIFDSVRAISIG